MNKYGVAIAAAAMLAACIPAAGHAQTTHFGDTVTFIAIGSNIYPHCVRFQTVATGGVQGFDNSSSGNSGHAGYTGNAVWNSFGVGTASNSIADVSGLAVALLNNSHITAGGVTVDWTDFGVNSTPIYADCNPAWNAAGEIGG